MVDDIKALCYIIALKDEWNLEIDNSETSYLELCKSYSERAIRAQTTWKLFVETQDMKKLPKITETNCFSQRTLLDLHSVSDKLRFINDMKDREIIRSFLGSGAEVLLTTDYKHLANKKVKYGLARIGINVMRPAEWLDLFLEDLRGDEDAIGYLERILFSVG
jgi:predicted nucleic acid-binding protein